MPAGKMSGRPRANSGSAGSFSDEGGVQPDSWADRRSSADRKGVVERRAGSRPRSFFACILERDCIAGGERDRDRDRWMSDGGQRERQKDG